MNLKDLKVSQLARAVATITGEAVGPKSFNYKAKAVARVAALMKERRLTMADVLKAAGITLVMVDESGAAPAESKITRAPNPPQQTKQARIVDLLRRNEGATIAELQEATGWRAHTCRGFLSGALRKKFGLDITSTKSETGERVYRILG